MRLGVELCMCIELATYNVQRYLRKFHIRVFFLDIGSLVLYAHRARGVRYMRLSRLNSLFCETTNLAQWKHIGSDVSTSHVLNSAKSPPAPVDTLFYHSSNGFQISVGVDRFRVELRIRFLWFSRA